MFDQFSISNEKEKIDKNFPTGGGERQTWTNREEQGGEGRGGEGSQDVKYLIIQ